MSLPELITNVVTITQPNIKARNQKFSVKLHNLRHERYCSDALRLRQILINLLSNASKFTPAGGEVSMDIEERKGEDELSVFLDMVITDTGIGMSEEFMEHIFEPFPGSRTAVWIRRKEAGWEWLLPKGWWSCLEGLSV